MPVVVRPCTYSDVEAAPAFGVMLDEYGDESSVTASWRPVPQGDTYRALEAAGVLHVLGAFDGDVLVGFLSILVTVLPHFGRRAAVTESFFVAPVARKTGAGLALLHKAETLAASLGAEGLLVSTPIDGALDHVMACSSSYRPSNRVYFKELGA